MSNLRPLYGATGVLFGVLSIATSVAPAFSAVRLARFHHVSRRMLKRQNASAAPKNTKNEFAVSPLETRVLGQREWTAGSPAALRVIVTDHNTGRPIPAQVQISWVLVSNGRPGDYPAGLIHAETDVNGSLNRSFAVPSWATGPAQVTIQVRSALGDDKVQMPIEIKKASQILLTCDKPLYQPGQTMHVRALALNMGNRAALADAPITFEIEDARGNKVFKKRDTLSSFGVAGAEFVLADEVNMGTFTLRAVLPDTQVEKKVRVERYVLPKYKTTLTTTKPFYLTGDTVSGTVEVRYFFGKPVENGEVTVTVNTIDIGVTKLTELKGKTDASGKYTFTYTLPKSFVGQPFEQGKAVVEFAGVVRDGAEHRQEVHTSVPVVKDPITLVVVPESKTLVPGVENRAWIACATPDGKPLSNQLVSIRPASKDVKYEAYTTRTDDLGIATAQFRAGKEPVTLTVETTDASGHKATASLTLQPSGATEGVLLRSDKTLAKVGETLRFTGLTSAKAGTLYLDIIRDKQTILTRAESMHGGKTTIEIPITPDMTGTLQVHAYKILPDENIVRDTRTIVVSPADDLNIKAEADLTEYKPGGDATIRFTVTDAQKHPVLAALGIAVVDESVFALSELQPGLEKIYFTLEKELMEPKYEIHGLTPTGLIAPPPGTPLDLTRRDETRQRAAAMILASVPDEAEFDFRANTYLVRAEAVRQKAAQVMMDSHRKAMNAVQKYYQDTKATLSPQDSLFLLVDKGYLQTKDLRDPWGNFYKSELYGQPNYNNTFALSSAGPDGKWDTNDDIRGITYYYGLMNGNGIRQLRRGRGGLREEMEIDALAVRDGAVWNAAPGGFGGGGREFRVRRRARYGGWPTSSGGNVAGEKRVHYKAR